MSNMDIELLIKLYELLRLELTSKALRVRLRGARGDSSGSELPAACLYVCMCACETGTFCQCERFLPPLATPHKGAWTNSSGLTHGHDCLPRPPNCHTDAVPGARLGPAHEPQDRVRHRALGVLQRGALSGDVHQGPPQPAVLVRCCAQVRLGWPGLAGAPCLPDPSFCTPLVSVNFSYALAPGPLPDGYDLQGVTFVSSNPHPARIGPAEGDAVISSSVVKHRHAAGSRTAASCRVVNGSLTAKCALPAVP